MDLIVRVEGLEAEAMTDAASYAECHDRGEEHLSYVECHDRDEEHPVNETPERSGSFRKKMGIVVGDVTEGADIPTVSESRSEGTQVVIDNTTLPAAVESIQQNQLGNGSFIQATVGAVLLAAAIASATTVTAVQRKETSLVVKQVCPSPGKDLEKGNLSTESTLSEDAPDRSSYFYRPPYFLNTPADNEYGCRICLLQRNDLQIIKLECACEGYLSRAHVQCALSWFEDRPNWQGSIPPPEFRLNLCRRGLITSE